jgi:hypothetical protein
MTRTRGFMESGSGKQAVRPAYARDTSWGQQRAAGALLASLMAHYYWVARFTFLVE